MEFFFAFAPVIILLWLLVEHTERPAKGFWYKQVLAFGIWGLLLLGWTSLDKETETIKVQTVTFEDQTSVKGFFKHNDVFVPVPNNVVSVQATYPRWGSLEGIIYETVTN